MITITPLQHQVYKYLLEGKSRAEIRQIVNKNTDQLFSIVKYLCDKGVLRRKGRAKLEPTGIEFEIADLRGVRTGRPIKALTRKAPKLNTLPSIDDELLYYIKEHYPFYRNRRGELARRLGMTRTLLNQIAIEYGLANGG